MKDETFPKGGRSTIKQPQFPLFGYIYLGLSVWLQFVWGGVKAAKILLLVDELKFSENEAVIIIHLQASLMDLVMCFGNILANLYCGPYIACLLQEVLKAFFTCPICTLATMGLIELDGRRKLYLIGQAIGVLTAFANSSLASFLSDQFNEPNYVKFNRTQIIITMACSALGIFTVPHLIQYYQCFWTETCYSMVWLCEWAGCVITLFIFIILCKKLQCRKPKYSATYMLLTLARDASKKKKLEVSAGGVSDRPLMEYSNLYTPKFRRDAQKMLSMWTFYFPLAGFWALHSQQSTTWVLQAKKLDGNLYDWSTVLPNELWGIIPLTGIAIRMGILSFVGEAKYPLRMTVFSQLILAFAFLLAALLEKYIMDLGDQQVHIVWTLPQLLLVSFSDITLVISYRKFIIREVPASFRGVTQTLFLLSRCLGNAIVVLVNVMEMQTKFPNRLGQFIFYATVVNLFLIMYIVMSRKFERLLLHEKESQAGPSTSRKS
ncbi:peptide transporter 3 [Halyomorpha halys]|uniref:peptide transporter 3 n=1 Tax=Halyomorpha halys TaxID=286706 RepID=UPI0006D50AFB|nr:peptide transporter 3 [Halyomorpha halys]